MKRPAPVLALPLIPGGVHVARALAAAHGLNPATDINIVVAGEGAQTSALLRSKPIEAFSQFDTQFALVENAGVKLRMLDTKDIDRFPSNGLPGLEDTLKTRRAEAVAVARGYAMGTIFAIANPEAAIRIPYEVFPQTKPTDEASAVHDDGKVLLARADKWKLDRVGAKRWGESLVANDAAYVDFLLEQGVIKQKVDAAELLTNELIDDINTFDAAKIIAEAKGYKPH